MELTWKEGNLCSKQKENISATKTDTVVITNRISRKRFIIEIKVSVYTEVMEKLFHGLVSVLNEPTRVDMIVAISFGKYDSSLSFDPTQ